MTRRTGRFLKACLAAATIVMMSANGVVATSPAVAAAPAQHILNGFGTYCLDQHFNASGATTLVRTWPGPCHTVGNQQWRFEYVREPNAYRVVNNRWDTRGLWCLSAPNGNNSDVYAELCVNPVPRKQTWIPSLRSSGHNQLRNELSFQCMEQDDNDLTRVYVRTCDTRERAQDWFWI